MAPPSSFTDARELIAFLHADHGGPGKGVER
jgi:hypothetical protein